MTIGEVVIVVAIASVLAPISIPMYSDYRHRTMIAQVESDIRDLNAAIAKYETDHNGRLPDSLADIGKAELVDPWGNAYGYLNHATLKGNGHPRKHKNLGSINSDFDLYSKGQDGDSQEPLTAQTSRDDVIRANNGRYIGLASEY